ncbi:hypothetical protein [Lacunimicrobium album]
MKSILGIAIVAMAMVVTVTESTAKAGPRHRPCEVIVPYQAGGYYGAWCVPGYGAFPYGENYNKYDLYRPAGDQRGRANGYLGWR